MAQQSIYKYLVTTFLLCIPPIAWNLAFGGLLPEYYANLWFDSALSWLILIPEIFFRIAIVVLSFTMPLFIYTRVQYMGLVLYLGGLFLYFLSWRPLILFPSSEWSTSLIGFTAPIFAQVVLLSGIALIGYRWFLKYRFSRWYFFSVSILYSIFRFLHVMMVYFQDNPPSAS